MFYSSSKMLMKTILWGFALLLSLPLSAQIQSGMSLNLEPAPTAQAAMTWETTTADLGRVHKGAEASYTFTVLNAGKVALELQSVKPSCSCTVTDYTKTPIAPGESGTVTASYAAKSTGYFNKTLTVQTNTEAGTIVLRIRGEVVDTQ